MANLIISEVCNFHCPYCFSSTSSIIRANHKGDGKQTNFIDIIEFQKRLEFLHLSHIDEIRLIGGEPTLHPQFREILALAASRQKRVVVFSHGIVSQTVLKCLHSYSPELLTVLVNMNAVRRADVFPDLDAARRENVINRLGNRALLGYTIDRVDFEIDSLIPLVIKNRCIAKIRLGLAHPVLVGTNQFLHPKQYTAVGNKITNFVVDAAAQGIKVEFDCGFVRCMFSNQDIDRLQKVGIELGWRCNPIMDISLDDQIYHCFPLAIKYKIPFNYTLTANHFRAILIDETSPYRQTGIYKECSTCPFKRSSECAGGCLSTTIRRFARANQHLVVQMNGGDKHV